MAHSAVRVNDEPSPERLATTIPQYMIRLAQEPTVGLHHVAVHAQRRVVPGLVSIRENISKESVVVKESALDAKYTSEFLDNTLETALASMEQVSAQVKEANESVSKALQQ